MAHNSFRAWRRQFSAFLHAPGLGLGIEIDRRGQRLLGGTTTRTKVVTRASATRNTQYSTRHFSYSTTPFRSSRLTARPE